MYIRITTRCNMSCAHCCMNATAKGTDMSMETYLKALKVARDNDDHIMLGGGEPTLHPDFELMLVHAIAESFKGEEYAPAVVTNGSITKLALFIAKLTDKGIVAGELSQDCFHDDIDDVVVEAFTKLKAIRDVTHDYDGSWRDPVLVGRWVKRSGLSRRPAEAECACDDTVVMPNGKIYQCGCPRSPCIGNVDDGYTTKARGVCYRGKEYKEAC